jgi:peptidoglycan-N-acetylglucosamine deacetylase
MSSRTGVLAAFAVLTGAALAQTAGSPADRPGTARPTVTATTADHRLPAQPRHTRRTPRGKVLYLTFDDGPHPRWTPKVLRLLARYHARATFFMLGREVSAHPGLALRVRRAGHAVGNHTRNHRNLLQLPPAGVRAEIAGGPRSRCFRPPFRDTNAFVRRMAAAHGMREMLWDVDTFDWSRPGADAIERAVLRQVHPGAVVLMHDGGGDRSQTLTALARVLPVLKSRGYTFRALSC